MFFRAWKGFRDGFAWSVGAGLLACLPRNKDIAMSAATEAVILAVDLGTSGVKAALITVHGKALGWEFEPIGLLITPDGGAEQSPDEWWQAFLSASRRLLARGLAPAGAIRAICCSTQGEGTIPVDADGNA